MKSPSLKYNPTHPRGGSGFPRGKRIILQKFCQKLHENERKQMLTCDSLPDYDAKSDEASSFLEFNHDKLQIKPCFSSCSDNFV